MWKTINTLICKFSKPHEATIKQLKEEKQSVPEMQLNNDQPNPFYLYRAFRNAYCFKAALQKIIP